ncbi:mechanosensitive ion channel family protein [Alkalinema sp. FACHB-956]|uniref:mechanosensitive ion channel family protein n=1 Tax=Alkalinema sp. FACHB-956 TaxID=2692768 RepID=UPI001689814B|nr:mechanosensitive ion channel family protein [Alkalinema sp. FACHB-956]MBD2328947.1 mechanosensitive ion channel family protein [Alkalinema sp. FACHB-956]
MTITDFLSNDGVSQWSWQILPKFLGAIVILLCTNWIGTLSVSISKRLLNRIEPTLQRFLLQVLKILIWVVGSIAALNTIGIETTTLVAIVGAAGLAVGLALQNSLSHLAAGIMLISFRHFEVGDTIEGGGVSGAVDSIGLFSTTIVTGDNVRITIPNSQLFSGTLKNQTVLGTRRVDIRIPIGDRPLQPTLQDLLAIAEHHPKVLTHPKPIAQVTVIGTHSTTISLKPWCQSSDYDQVRADILYSVKRHLEQSQTQYPTVESTIDPSSDASSMNA